MFKSSFYELNDTPVSNTIFIIEKTPPPLRDGAHRFIQKGQEMKLK